MIYFWFCYWLCASVIVGCITGAIVFLGCNFFMLLLEQGQLTLERLDAFMGRDRP